MFGYFKNKKKLRELQLELNLAKMRYEDRTEEFFKLKHAHVQYRLESGGWFHEKERLQLLTESLFSKVKSLEAENSELKDHIEVLECNDTAKVLDRFKKGLSDRGYYGECRHSKRSVCGDCIDDFK